MASNFWEGEKVTLRGVEEEDWQVFVAWDKDTEIARSGYFIPFPQSQAAAQKLAAEMALQRSENDAYRWMMVNREGEVVGTLNTHSVERRDGTFSYGVAVRREFWGRGYANEAIRIVLQYYFEELRYQKCTVDIDEYNVESIRLHERLGFQLEGRLRRMKFTRGKHWDCLKYGITREEFMRGWEDRDDPSAKTASG
jgi:RimJ/RimL family protein N-acetyltransferase